VWRALVSGSKLANVDVIRAGEVPSMIDREPLKRGANDGRRPEKPVRRNLGAGCSHIPVIARLPIALKRRIVGVDDPAYGECRVERLGVYPWGGIEQMSYTDNKYFATLAGPWGGTYVLSSSM
jgi:hypothetical protein